MHFYDNKLYQNVWIVTLIPSITNLTNHNLWLKHEWHFYKHLFQLNKCWNLLEFEVMVKIAREFVNSNKTNDLRLVSRDNVIIELNLVIK
jgi:hypothetical protein